MGGVSVSNRLGTRRTQDQRGFTLIELLVVVTILGILAAVVVFSVRGVTDKGQSSAEATDAQVLRTAEEAYCAKNGNYATEPQLVSAGLLASVGTDNTIETTNTGPCTGTPGGPSGFNVVCTITTTNTCAGAPAAGAIVRGGTMVLSATFPGAPYNPAVTSSGQSHPIDEAVFNGLYAFDPSGNVVPDLASALPAVQNNGDGSQDVTVTLRSGMVWQDNTPTNPDPITAGDVVFSYEQAILRGQGRTGGSMGPALGFTFNNTAPGSFSFSGGGNITMPNGPTGLVVDFHFIYPYENILIRQMNVTEAAIIPQQVYGQCADASAGGNGALTDTLLKATCPGNVNPVGSGPFTWGGFTNSGNVLTLNKNPQYFKAGLPYLSKVVMEVLSSPATATSALQGPRSSGIDSASIPAGSLATFANSSYATASVPRGSGGGNCINTIAFNLWQPTNGTGVSLLPEFPSGDPGITNGLPGTSAGKNQAQVAALPVNTPYDNPILSSNLVRKALFEGFNRGTAANNDLGVTNAVGAPAGTARM